MLSITLALSDLLQQYVGLGQIVSEIIAFGIIFSLAIIIAWIGHSIFKRYLCRWTSRTQTNLDDEILRNVRAPIFLLGILFGLYYGLIGIASLQAYAQYLSTAFTVGQILVIAFVLTRITNVLISWYAEQRVKREKTVNNHILFIFKKVLQIVVYVFAFILILGVFGQDLSGVIVGFGVGGIAIALAIQNILSDALTAFSIYFDRPFEIGDFIVIGEYAGTVTKIGIISTRIQLLQGEELVISNKNLISTSVRNFKKLQRRRIVFSVKVTNDTSLEKLKKIPQIIAKILGEMKMATLDRVHFKQLGDFSLDFEVVYYIKTGDYNKYMDIQQEINYGILEAFEKEKIETAYPTQKIFYVNEKEAS
ncbi:mechanosensitive ion channel family protein [Candidatus Bathyarchaeota archaeon]|jgi:small-conductance mechanosensitive channel|nr:mechanosensitive ion channel family protein [Candidatus Bathyarchaeota archaeon]